MTVWPEGGPDLIWEYNDLGTGFSSVTVSKDAIYITGRKGESDVITSLSLDGNKKWETIYGNAWTNTYPDSRSTPTYFNGKLYVLSGQGELVCLDTHGNIIWKNDVYTNYGSNPPRFGISESLLVFDDKVMVTPGGSQVSMVAYHIDDGNLIWEAKSLDENTQYVNPKLIKQGNKNIVVTLLSDHIIGINVDTGEILWKEDYRSHNNAEGRFRTNHTITPVYHDSHLFVTSGYNYPALMLKIGENGKSVAVIWRNDDLDPHHGGIVLVNGYLFGSTYDNNARGEWACVDWKTGETRWKSPWHNKGSVIAADGMLYLYEEKGGHVGLAKASPESFEVVSEFKIVKGEGPHWAHPVIREGKLYIRHGDTLMVYLIK
jgi:outer membrane protein assembly factor BamB